MSNFILAKTRMPDGTAIQLENWEDNYPSLPSLWWTIGAYPRSKHESGLLFGPRRGGEFRLTISFGTEAEAMECMNNLECGNSELLDYRERFWNGENDAELLED